MTVIHVVPGLTDGWAGGREGGRGVPKDAVGVGVLHVLVGDDDVILVGHIVGQGVLHHQPEEAREGGREGGRNEEG